MIKFLFICFVLVFCVFNSMQLTSFLLLLFGVLFFPFFLWKIDFFILLLSMVSIIIISSQYKYNIYILQSSLPTTIYVQNLSFLVSQILTSISFFSISPIYMIFMRDMDKMCNFLIHTKKKVKKGKIWNFVKKSKFWKNHHFFSSVPFEYPFYPFFTFL